MTHKHIRVDQEAHQRFKVSAVIHGDTHTEHCNRLLDIADAAADALVALDNCKLEKPGSEFEWIGYIEKMRGLLS